MSVESRELEALAALRRLEVRRRSFRVVFAEVCANARSSARSPAERAAWGHIEEAISIDLRRE